MPRCGACRGRVLQVTALCVAVSVLVTLLAGVAHVRVYPGSYLTLGAHNHTVYQHVASRLADANPTPTIEPVLEEQRRRQQQLRRACAALGVVNSSAAHAARSGATHFILVEPRHRLLYCFIPKTGCTNWRRVLAVLGNATSAGQHLNISQDDVHEKIRIPELEQFPVAARERMLNTYYKFVFVREPYARLLSAFRDKFVDNYPSRFFTHFYKTIVHKYRSKSAPGGLNSPSHGTGSDPGFTLSEFVRLLTESDHDNPRFSYEPHWERYWRLCAPCHVRWNFIGHVESMARDADHVLRLLNLTRLTGGFPSMASTGYSPAPGHARLRDHYSRVPRELLDRLRRIYRDDFRMFGYDPDLV